MKVREYLATLKRVIITCRPENTIETAATLLATNHIGAMSVRDASGRIVGMFSERDIIRAFSQRGKEVERLLVRDLMATRLIACAPEDAMVTARKLMKANRIPAPAGNGG
jgi:CBS domain-containing protein